MDNSVSKYTAELGRHITLRKEAQKDDTQKAIADKLGLSQNTITSIVKGESDPKLSTIIAFADLFETSIDELVGYSPKAPVITPEHSRTLDSLKTMSSYLDAIDKFKKDEGAHEVVEFVQGCINHILNGDVL